MFSEIIYRKPLVFCYFCILNKHNIEQISSKTTTITTIQLIKYCTTSISMKSIRYFTIHLHEIVVEM